MTAITVPIDASQIPEQERGKQNVRVAVRAGKEVHSKVVSVKSGRASAKFEIDAGGPVTIGVGPESASAEDIFLRDTPTVTVRPRKGGDGATYHVDPIALQPHIWLWWWRWCRTFTITGHVYGTDGNPVPGRAEQFEQPSDRYILRQLSGAAIHRRRHRRHSSITCLCTPGHRRLRAGPR